MIWKNVSDPPKTFSKVIVYTSRCKWGVAHYNPKTGIFKTAVPGDVTHWQEVLSPELCHILLDQVRQKAFG